MHNIAKVKVVGEENGETCLLLVDDNGDEVQLTKWDHSRLIDTDRLIRTRIERALRSLTEQVRRGMLLVEREKKGLATLPHPDTVGSAEYRAVYELLEDAEDPESHSTILDEFIAVARDCKRRLGA